LATIRLLQREAALVKGEPPITLGGITVQPGRWALSGGEYLLRTERELRFHYRQGSGVRLAIRPGCSEGEIELWRNGSVYSAIAAINGLVPLHASAIAQDGEVTAFTGPAGSGKSTLIAALSALGYAMFCDDTLVLNLDSSTPILALPGHKRLKLTEEALALTGTQREGPVAPDLEKFYARPISGAIERPLPLRKLVYLEFGDALALLPVEGAEKLRRLGDEHYTTALQDAAVEQDRSRIFARRSRLAGEVEMYRLVRPRDPAQIMASARYAAAHLL
jgi:hypothetical protein